MTRNFTKGIIIGLFAGAIFGGLLSYKLIAKDKYEFGKHQGYITGGLDVIKFLNLHFGTDKHDSKAPLFFNFKDIQIKIKRINKNHLQIQPPSQPV